MNPQNMHADRTLDITKDLCPMTFVRTRLALDRLAPGQKLLVLLRGDEPRRADHPVVLRQLGLPDLSQSEQRRQPGQH